MNKATTSPKKTGKVVTKKTPGPNIVRAWFDTAINPLLRSLEMEQAFLEQKNWTWQFRPSHLGSIRPVRDHFDIDIPNLELFLSFHPRIERATRVHDQKVKSLYRLCFDLESAIANSQALRKVYEEVTSQQRLEKLGKTLDELFGAYPKQDHLYLLAQYIVNNTGFLPDHYYTAPLWNQYRDNFLAILNDPCIEPLNRQTVQVGESLLKTVKELITLLEETREGLALKRDVPPGTPQSLIA